MKKTVFSVALFSVLNLGAQQISSSKWRDLFSYNNILAIKSDGDRMIAAAENGLFYYNPKTGDLSEKLSKANGLHNVGISAFDYNPATKTGLIGYEDGTMDVFSPEGIFYIVDIPFASGFSGRKTINHIFIKDDKAVISVDYGVSVFNLKRREFGDTAFFSTNGSFEKANEAVIKDNTVYAATPSGIKSHELGQTNFPVYTSWATVQSGNFSQISANSSSVAYSDGSAVWLNNSPISQSFSSVQDITFNGDNFAVTDQTGTAVFSAAGILINKLNSTENLTTGLYFGGETFAGSLHSGIINSKKDHLKPDGPYANFSYKFNFLDDKIWVSTGYRMGRYNEAPDHPRNLGFYYFDGKEWIYPPYFSNTKATLNILDALPNPADPSEMYFANYTKSAEKGIYKLKYTNLDFTEELFIPLGSDFDLQRPVGFAYDEANNIFATYTLFNKTPNPAYAALSAKNQYSTRIISTRAGAQKPLYSEGFLWVPNPMALNGEFVAIDLNKTPQNLNDDKFYFVNTQHNMPADAQSAISIAIDKNSDAWLGTDKGLRILSNANAEVQRTPKAEPIIITQNGVGEELFRDAAILQIAVDSGNQKWVSVEGGGIFYLSANGEKTYLHFTKANSPLPTNDVTDIKINEKTGEVFFATIKGIVAYKGDVSNVTGNFGEVLVYPNPVVYSQFKGNVKIKGLAETTNIRITDAAGNLVMQDLVRGGYYEWDLNNFRGKRVASGIYFVLMTNADGTDKATAKIAVVN